MNGDILYMKHVSFHLLCNRIVKVSIKYNKVKQSFILIKKAHTKLLSVNKIFNILKS